MPVSIGSKLGPYEIVGILGAGGMGLFTEELPPGNLFRPQNYDVAPDGKRFLMIRPDDTERQPPTVTVVMNWFSELERRVPIR